MACADFADACLNHGIGMSREDLKFMNTVEGSFIQCEEVHYQVRLPFRNQSLVLPANRCQAERRTLPESKFPKDAIFQEDNATSLENVIQEGFAEKVPLKIYIEQTTRSSIVHIIGCITARKLRR